MVVVVASVKFEPASTEGAYILCTKDYLSISAGPTFVGCPFFFFFYQSTEYRGGEVGRLYFDSAGGCCWTMRTPAMRAGLKDRSQSAYAAPAPKPVERAMGHARPETGCLRKKGGGVGAPCFVFSRTAEEDDGCDDAEAKADTTAGAEIFC